MISSAEPGLWFERVFKALGLRFPIGVYGVAYLPHALLLFFGPGLVGYPGLGGFGALGLLIPVLINMTILLYGVRYMRRRLERLTSYAQSELLTGVEISNRRLYGAGGR